MKAGWWDTPLALRESNQSNPIISGNGLPLLTENNFQTPLLFVPLFIDIRVSVGPPFLLRAPPPPLLFGTGEYSDVFE